MIEDNVLAATDTLILLGVLVISALFIGAFTIRPKVEKSLENVTDKTVTMKDKIKEQSTVDFGKMTKAKLDEYGESKGIKLDRRKTKANMIADLEAAMKGNNHKLGK